MPALVERFAGEAGRLSARGGRAAGTVRKKLSRRFPGKDAERRPRLPGNGALTGAAPAPAAAADAADAAKTGPRAGLAATLNEASKFDGEGAQ